MLMKMMKMKAMKVMVMIATSVTYSNLAYKQALLFGFCTSDHDFIQAVKDTGGKRACIYAIQC